MIIREKVRIGDQVVTLETGRIAKQAGGSCLVRAGDTMVLVTVCGNQEARPGQSFLPLSVDYQEKTYAAGKIPGGFFKREGKLRDYEVLTSRLIDRPCRPLFPEGYRAEIQVVATVMSFDQENPPDILAMVGASAALHMSPIPWAGPIAGVRVARVDGEFIANPTYAQMAESDCELLVVASRDAIVMVEGEAEEISEDDLLEALFFAHRAVQDTIDLIERMREAVGKSKWVFKGDESPAILRERVRQIAFGPVREACAIANKAARSDAFKQVRRETLQILGPEFPGQEELIKGAFEDLRYQTMRNQVLDEGRRLDNRDTRTVRPISIELGILPRTHGSSLFTRGETQAIVTTTLGTTRDSQRLDTLQGDQHKRFMLHYNFPPYSVGEVKPMRGPGRREIGHGDLAERALLKVLPSAEEFPYAIRIVSEVTESNGSSSMASVCGGALALMDAGVPIKAAVAGIAMGLIKEGERYAVLTDILGDEDALGDMDFKVCGTEKGVTAIQMDIKIEGLSRDILERALSQAREARLHILDKMQRAIPAPREELSLYAPRITQIRVKPDQVRTIIGPGGKMIRAIVDQTGASIDVADDGTVSVASADALSVLKALDIIKSLTTDPEIGEIYEGVVKRIEPYGAFLEIMPGKDGLCHISDVDWTHVTNVEDYFKLGDKVPVKLTNIDREGRIRLSRKDAIPEPAGAAAGAARLNGRSEERTFDKPREERVGRGRTFEREELPVALLDEEESVEPVVVAPRDFDREGRSTKPRDFDRDRPGRARDLDRDERSAKPRDFDRDRPARARDLDRDVRPVRGADLDSEERGIKPRDFDRDRPARPRDLDREERSVKPRDFDRDRPARARDLDSDVRPVRGADLDNEERGIKPRDFDRDRPARVRDFDREERSAKPRILDRDVRPPRVAELDGEERVIKPRELDEPRAPRARGVERVGRSRDLDRVVTPRDADVDERVAKPRDLDRVARTRDLERDLERGRTPRLRDETRPRERALLDEPEVRSPARVDRERPVRDEPREALRGARRGVEERPRMRTRELEPTDVVKPRELEDERPASIRATRELGERGARRDFDDRASVKPRSLERERPARIARDLEREAAPRPARDAGRELDREVGGRSRRDFDERPARAEARGGELDRPARSRRDVIDERPVARPRLRDDERELVRPREDVRPARRDVDLDERPRLRRDERDDDRFERRPARPDSDRPVRGRGTELPNRTPLRRTERVEDTRAVEEDAFTDGPVVSARERDDRVERDRPSRTRSRARNRERVREVERERERD